jgi:hypothetical protein
MSEPLPPEVIERLVRHDLSERNLREMRVVTGNPWRRIPPLFRAGAMTFGRRVIFKQGRYDPTTGSGLALIAHESGHIEQYRDLGWFRFFWRYGRGLLTTRGHDNHPMERELVEMQDRLEPLLVAELAGERGSED